MTANDAAPRTAAGRALLTDMDQWRKDVQGVPWAWRAAILAIEAEARATATLAEPLDAERLRRGMPKPLHPTLDAALAAAGFAIVPADTSEAVALLRESLLRVIEQHAFFDYPTPHCDCEEWPANGDPDRYFNDHLATVLAHLPEEGP